MESISAKEPSLIEAAGAPLTSALAFWDNLRTSVAPKLLHALAASSGSNDVLIDAHFNYRMVDYYSRPRDSTPPRCGEHRDFGTFTLLFSREPGLQANVAGKWVDLAPPPEGGAVLLFGWCTEIRSNGRLPAVLHRVVDASGAEMTPRRTSAVLFVAPKDVHTPLEPVLREGEPRRYLSGVRVGQLRGSMARKWRHREGTLNAEDRALEEEEIRVTQMSTQDHVVRKTIMVQP